MRTEATIGDPALAQVIEDQMRAGGLSWLRFEPLQDVSVAHLKLAVWEATICEGFAVADVWLISGGPSGFQFPYAGRYNKENYPELMEAVAKHVGQLVVDGRVMLVNPDNGDV